MARIHALHEFPPFATPYAKSCFCFPSLWQSKRKKPNFFAKNDSGKTLAEVTEKTLQDQRGRKEDLERITSGYVTQLRMNRSIQTEGSDKCAFSAVQVLYQIYKLNLSFYSKKTSTSKVGDELRLLLT